MAKAKKKAAKKTTKRKAAKKTAKRKAAKKTAKRTRKPTGADQAIAAIDSAQASRIRKPKPAASASATTKRRPGRPPGPAIARPFSSTDASRCKKCGSTNRTRYTSFRKLEYPGKSPTTGEDCSHVILRNTTCKDCKQARTDREYVNEPT